MSTADSIETQVANLIQRLPFERRLKTLVTLAGTPSQRELRMKMVEDRLRRLCAERQLDWDQLSDFEREELVNDLVHEGR